MDNRFVHQGTKNPHAWDVPCHSVPWTKKWDNSSTSAWEKLLPPLERSSDAFNWSWTDRWTDGPWGCLKGTPSWGQWTLWAANLLMGRSSYPVQPMRAKIEDLRGSCGQRWWWICLRAWLPCPMIKQRFQKSLPGELLPLWFWKRWLSYNCEMVRKNCKMMIKLVFWSSRSWDNSMVRSWCVCRMRWRWMKTQNVNVGDSSLPHCSGATYGRQPSNVSEVRKVLEGQNVGLRP